MPPKNTLNAMKKAYADMSAAQASDEIRKEIQTRVDTVAGLKHEYTQAPSGRRSALTRRMNTLTAEMGVLGQLLESYAPPPAEDPAPTAVVEGDGDDIHPGTAGEGGISTVPMPGPLDTTATGSSTLGGTPVPLISPIAFNPPAANQPTSSGMATGQPTQMASLVSPETPILPGAPATNQPTPSEMAEGGGEPTSAGASKPTATASPSQQAAPVLSLNLGGTVEGGAMPALPRPGTLSPLVTTSLPHQGASALPSSGPLRSPRIISPTRSEQQAASALPPPASPRPPATAELNQSGVAALPLPSGVPKLPPTAQLNDGSLFGDTVPPNPTQNLVSEPPATIDPNPSQKPASKPPAVTKPHRSDITSRQPPRPRPRPVVPKKPTVGGSKDEPLIIEDEDVKPALPPGTTVDVNMDSEAGMRLLTPAQKAALLQVTEELADGGLPGSKRKNATANESSSKRRRAGKSAEKEGVSEGSGKRKRVAGGDEERLGDDKPVSKKKREASGSKEKGNAKERNQENRKVDRGQEGDGSEEPKGQHSVKGKGKGRQEELSSAEDKDAHDEGNLRGGVDGDGDEDEYEAEGSGEEGSGKGRKRAAKKQRTGWILVGIHAIKVPGGRVRNTVVRIPVPIGESEFKRLKLDRKGWTEIHNYACGGLNLTCVVLLRSKRFRWYCGEVGATSRLLSLSAFILRNKRTRCHFHSGTDRTSTHNDQHPKLNKATGEAFHIVTGVPLASDDTTLGSPAALKKWTAFKTHHYPGLYPADRDPDVIPTKIGGMTEEDLLSFFHLHENGRRYLGCGCDLEHAIFDFFLWKTASHLFSDTVNNVECLGNPWDVRLRTTFANICSGMGHGPEKLDTMFKYNSEGKRNDISTAPQFVRDFWKVIEAQKAAQWPDYRAANPSRRDGSKLDYVDPEDMEDGEVVEFESGDELEPIPTRANTLRGLNKPESDSDTGSDSEEEEMHVGHPPKFEGSAKREKSLEHEQDIAERLESLEREEHGPLTVAGSDDIDAEGEEEVAMDGYPVSDVSSLPGSPVPNRGL